MSKIIEFHDEEFGTIYIEVADTNNKEGFRDINKTTDKIFEKLEGKFNRTLQSLQSFGKSVLATVGELKPSEVELKAGLKFEIKEGKLIGVFAQAKAEFPFEVTIKWTFDNKNENQTS